MDALKKCMPSIDDKWARIDAQASFLESAIATASASGARIIHLNGTIHPVNSAILEENGFRVRNLLYGTDMYQMANRVEAGDRMAIASVRW